MFEQLKRLGTDTAIYGISTVVARLLNFVLVPLYTNLLSPAEFGIQANIYASVALLIVFYSFGMESSYFRFAAMKEIGTEKDNFSTPFILIFIVSFFISLLLLIFSVPLTVLFQIEPSLHNLLYYTAGILFFDAIVMIPFASLRLQRKAKFFAATKVINIVATIILNIITVLYLRWGLEGIFFSNLCASAITFFILLPTTLKQLQISIHKNLLQELLKFGLPIMPVGLSGVLLQIVDRPILVYLMGAAANGIYQANFRLGIFMALINGMFEFAWRPFFLSHAKDSNAKQLFSRVMTYYLTGSFALFLLLSFFIPDLVQYKIFGKYLIHPRYWEGLNIVPFVMLSYIFSGIGTNLNAGIQIEKKTMYLLPTSLSGSITKIILTFALVPLFGIMGAAYATIIGYAVVAVALFIVTKKFYYIEYEYARIGKMLLLTIAAFLVFQYVSLSVVQKLLLFMVWCIGLFAVKFFNAGELQRLKNLLRKIS